VRETQHGRLTICKV